MLTVVCQVPQDIPVYMLGGKGVYFLDQHCTLQPWTSMCNPVLHLSASKVSAEQ